MSAMANITPIVTTVTKPATNPGREKTPRDADATPRVNIQDFCEEYYEDILPIIMDKIRRDKRKEVHARLDFGEGPRERRIRECSHYSSARTLSARYHNQSERLKVRDRLRYNDRHVLDRLGHRRQSAFDRLSETYSPSTTQSRPDTTSSRGRSRGGSRPHRRDSSNEIVLRVETAPATDRSRHVKRGRDSKSPLSRVSKSGSNDGGHWKSKSKRHKPTNEDDLTMPWMCEEVDSFTPISKVYQKKYVKDLVEIHNSKQKDEETIEDFMKRFKVETGRMKGAPECMRISRFMHRVNSPELTKRLNEHVPKTIEEMMITTTAFIRGEAAAAGKKKSHASWRTHDQSKRHTSKKRKVPAATTYGKLSHLIKEIKQGRDQSKVGKKEALAKDKSMRNYVLFTGNQQWDRMTACYRSENWQTHDSPHALGNNRRRRSFYKSMDEFHDSDGGIVTIRSTILIPAECATMITSSKEIPEEAGVRHENFKVALQPNFPDQEVAIGGTLFAKGRT
uniref:Reverse transcriptase domain-containing protein n=1 Tax=Tanacetum cinerariifolium TaxID=118510 RepID=A0A699HU24_TANCI|nr:reverse transcriptase domain-containing protein [Tanacetum cinerariifolium]